jgi:hypothetical protein
MSPKERLSRRDFAHRLTYCYFAFLLPAGVFVQCVKNGCSRTNLGRTEDMTAEEFTLIADTGDTFMTSIADGGANLITSRH